LVLAQCEGAPLVSQPIEAAVVDPEPTIVRLIVGELIVAGSTSKITICRNLSLAEHSFSQNGLNISCMSHLVASFRPVCAQLWVTASLRLDTVIRKIVEEE